MAVELAEKSGFPTLHWNGYPCSLISLKNNSASTQMASPSIYCPFRPERVLDPSTQHHTNLITTITPPLPSPSPSSSPSPPPSPSPSPSPSRCCCHLSPVPLPYPLPLPPSPSSTPRPLPLPFLSPLQTLSIATCHQSEMANPGFKLVSWSKVGTYTYHLENLLYRSRHRRRHRRSGQRRIVNQT